jgi:hypothetical protein
MHYQLRQNLEKLGFDTSTLPTATQCNHCKTDKPADYLYNPSTGEWTLQCKCGQGTMDHPSLHSALVDWNEINGQPAPYGESQALVDGAHG